MQAIRAEGEKRMGAEADKERMKERGEEKGKQIKISPSWNDLPQMKRFIRILSKTKKKLG